jgi:hypothetical protein
MKIKIELRETTRELFDELLQWLKKAPIRIDHLEIERDC